MATPTLLLASTSPHRRALLGRLGFVFDCADPRVTEEEVSGEVPSQRASRLALAKARAVADHSPGTIVIGSDQVASLAGDPSMLLHKPGNRENCLRQFRAMSGRSVQFDTAVAVIFADRVLEHSDVTKVRFRPLDDLAIESYMDREPSFDCAGGFKCEGLGVSLFDSVETCDPTALIGLPLIGLCGLLRRLGVAV